MDKKTLIADAIALVLYVLAANPAITGIPFHEWVSIGAMVILVVHCIMHYDWVANAVKLMFRRPSFKRTGRLLLNSLTAISLVVCFVSGLLISGTVLPAFGFYANGYYLWDPLHAFSAKVLLALIIVHICLHARQLWAYFSRSKKKEAKPDSPVLQAGDAEADRTQG